MTLKKSFVKLILVALSLSASFALDTCPNTNTSTLYDGYLAPNIYYASFSKD